MVYSNYSLSRKATIGQVLENGLKDFGFSEYSLSPDIHLATCDRKLRFFIKVSWKNVSRDATAEPPKKRLKGHTGKCQVCEEKKSLVVLAPCGHIMCQDCRDEQTKDLKCPFCRQHVLPVCF